MQLSTYLPRNLGNIWIPSSPPLSSSQSVGTISSLLHFVQIYYLLPILTAMPEFREFIISQVIQTASKQFPPLLSSSLPE